jgi:NDP-sugar pyrophosphorylase family protein
MLKCVLLAGGDAKRMLPITGGRFEKTMLRLKGKPIVRIVVDRIIQSGIWPFYIFVCVLDRFLDDFKWELRDIEGIGFDSSEKALGTLGHYMKAAEKFDPGDDVLVYYGDTIASIDLLKMEKAYHELKSECMIAVTTNLRHDYSAVDFDVNYLVTKMEEKPQMDFPSWTGIAILKHDLVKRYIPRIAADKMDFAKGLFPLLLEDMDMKMKGSNEVHLDVKPRFHAYSDSSAMYYDTGNVNSYLKLMDMAAEGTLNV